MDTLVTRRCGKGLQLLLLGLLAAACADGSAEDGASSAVATRGAGGVASAAESPSYDWLVSGGRVLDGTGVPAYRADILLLDGLIAHVGVVDPDTLEFQGRYDATGRVVAPGFIDLHAHGDPVSGPAFPNFLAQGVTTIVLGQDGSSPSAAGMRDRLDGVDRARPAVNVAYMVGHNTVRAESGVGHAVPGEEGMARMAALVETALAAGAFGLSLGLEYTPGSGAGLLELTRLAQPVAASGAVVASHLRSEDADRVEASVEELLEQGRRAGARVHVSHLKVVLGDDPGQAGRILDRMAGARTGGLEVTADIYPYTASFTGLAILFPDWARPPNDYGRVVEERRPELAEYLRERVEARNGPSATLFGTGQWAGRTLEEVAVEREIPFEDVLLDLGPGGASAAYFVMDDAVMERFLLDPHVTVASDGSPTMRHPRGYGAFARVLRQYVAEDGLLSLEDAIRKMTALPASILGLDDPERVDVRRGRVAEGWAADLVAFAPGAVRDLASFEAPHRLAAGMDRVWVNGSSAWDGGGPVGGEGAGRALRYRGACCAEPRR